MDLVLFGPPGAGKGTQAAQLVERLAAPQIATGDIMRAARKSGTELGKKFDEYMSAGLLVPDELVLTLVDQRLAADDAREGALFDGYPRTVPQAEALDALLADRGRKIDLVIALEVPLDEIVERAVGRRSCESCGQIYHLRYSPPPSADHCRCGGALTQRKDDTDEVVRQRFRQYQDKTAPLLDYYAQRGLVKKVNGVGRVEVVTQRINDALLDGKQDS